VPMRNSLPKRFAIAMGAGRYARSKVLVISPADMKLKARRA
jgi:hypothetical protein